MEQTLDIIKCIREQYLNHGIGRWAVIDNDMHVFMGWAGLKVESNVNGHDTFIDLGYRLLPEYWNKGYATEVSKALIEYGFMELNFPLICAYVEEGAIASQRVLGKCGLKRVSSFPGYVCTEYWYEITKDEFLESRNTVDKT